MKLLSKLAAAGCVLSLLAGTAVFAEKKEPAKEKKLTCCEKAAAEGKECTRKCCVAAHRAGRSCEKCNPGKEDLKKPDKKDAGKAAK